MRTTPGLITSLKRSPALTVSSGVPQWHQQVLHRSQFDFPAPWRSSHLFHLLNCLRRPFNSPLLHLTDVRGPALICRYECITTVAPQCFTHLASLPSLLQDHSKQGQIYWHLCQVGLCDQSFEASFSESPWAQETFLWWLLTRGS